MAEPNPTAALPSRIASLVHAHFDALPTRSKPNVFPDGSREWIPMTGMVVVKGMILCLAWSMTMLTDVLRQERTHPLKVCTA